VRQFDDFQLVVAYGIYHCGVVAKVKRTGGNAIMVVSFFAGFCVSVFFKLPFQNSPAVIQSVSKILMSKGDLRKYAK
jgi:hypothetical protein